MIVKVQRSIQTNSSEGPQLLVYNQDRTVEYQAPLPDEVKKWMGDRYKLYCKGKLTEDGLIHFGKIVPDQAW